MFREERDSEFHPADVNGSNSEYPEENVEEVNEPSTWMGRKCDCGEKKKRCGSGCGGRG